jgi:hypothetical protein
MDRFIPNRHALNDNIPHYLTDLENLDKSETTDEQNIHHQNYTGLLHAQMFGQENETLNLSTVGNDFKPSSILYNPDYKIYGLNNENAPYGK